MATARNHVPEIAMRGQFVHVGVDVDHQRLRPLAHRPVHGVALVEARTENQQAVEVAIENGVGGMARAGIAEYAEREFVVLREDALGAQRGGDRDRPALGDFPQPRGGRVVLDTGAGQDGDLPALPARQKIERGHRLIAAEGPSTGEEAADLHALRVAFPGQRIVRQREVDRAAGLRPHGRQGVAEPVIEIPAAGDRLGQPGQRRHHGRVVERRLAGVLERAQALHLDRHFAGHDHDGRTVGLRRRPRRSPCCNSPGRRCRAPRRRFRSPGRSRPPCRPRRPRARRPPA